MKVTLSWLNEFAPFGDDVEAIAANLTQLGMQVEEVIHVNKPVDGVIVAKVLARAPHPNADRVGLVFVDVGDGQSLQICCGAFNMQPGDLVPLATVGTIMPDGRNIQVGQMRGETSNGMLCSPEELGLGSIADPRGGTGIWILPEGLPLGSSPWVGAGVNSDVVFDLDLTRNRPECWGVVGIARDLAARMKVPFTIPGGHVAPSGETLGAPVEIVDGDRCGRFASVVITGVEVKPSAPWMQQRLSLAGMRPISNVVDVSNYVMLELNEPNHAYDLATLGGGGFRIRLATDGEKLTTLDGIERTLIADDLLICDAADQPIGLAGVMGGLNTEITDGTTTIALENAWFEPLGVQRSAARHTLRSEASVRFERGRDPYGIDHAANRFAELLRETCPNVQVHPGAVDARTDGLPQLAQVELRTERVNALLDTALTDVDIAALIAPIGFQRQGNSTTYIVPTWRPDCVCEIELIEEVARHYGYDNLRRTVPSSSTRGGLTPQQRDRRKVRQILLGLGFSEAMPNPWLAPGDTDRAQLGALGTPLNIANPMAAEESVLRTSLIPGLLKAIAYNESHRAPGVSFFEIGHVFRNRDDGRDLPDEFEHLAVVLAGREAPAAMAVWNELSTALGCRNPIVKSGAQPGLHPGRSAQFLVAGRAVGVVGEVHPDVLDGFGVNERVAVIEINLGQLLDLPHGPGAYRRVSRFPSTDIDLAFVAPAKVSADQLGAALRKAAGPLLADLQLFDVYRGSGLKPGERSLAYRLRLQADDRTLKEAEIAAVRAQLLGAANKLGAALRA
jgi:phenylalanyl-tRNA synthetase beta chain